MTVRPLLDAFRDYLSLRDEPVVREWLGGFDWKLSERNLAANSFPAVRHLPQAAVLLGRAEARLGECFIESASRLHWLQSYTADDFGQHFVDNYAHVELIGLQGHFMSDEIAAGLVLYGPDLEYPDHWHVAEEIYIPLTGNGLWSMDREEPVLRKAGEFIFHESNTPHAIATRDTPLLALWVWRGGDLVQKGNY